MPLPVVICEIPGCEAMASMIFVEPCCCKSANVITLMGVGILMACEAPACPVTTTSFISMTDSSIMKSLLSVVFKSIFSAIIL